MDDTACSQAVEARFWAKVDRAGEVPAHAPTLGPCWNWTAARGRGGYGNFWRGGGVYVNAHRFAWELAHGVAPQGMEVDHRCHNRACVNPAHLRLVTPGQNQQNRAGAQRGSASGVRGVYWSKAARAWCARVTHQKVCHWVGSFATLAEAEAAVIAKRRELFTHNDADSAGVTLG
nr:MAG TPA_asm: homing endonuclease [Caudoviricetes sp.]